MSWWIEWSVDYMVVYSIDKGREGEGERERGRERDSLI